MKIYDGIMQGLNEAVEYNQNKTSTKYKELIELAREHATYDIPEGTCILLERLANALEREESLKKHIIISLRPFLLDDAELEALVSREIHLLQRPHNPPTQEEVITRQTKAAKLIKEAKDKLFGRKQKSDVPHWIMHDICYYGVEYECSVCGKRFEYDDDICYDDPCPACGTVMDVEAEEVIEYGYDSCGR